MNAEEYIEFLFNQFVPDGMNEDELPIWVINLKDKFMSSVFKKFKEYDSEDIDPNQLAGFVAGAVKHLEETSDKVLSKINVPKDIEISEPLEKQLDEDEDLIRTFVEDTENIQKDLDSKTESEFLKSKIEGLSSLFTNDSNIKYESLDTKLTFSMLIAWPYIHKNIKTRKECFKFLVVKLGESQIGSYERVEKFFERIEYSPAKVGRPKNA
ncbi:hypothetical protein OAQ34_08410 [Opitutales bacterium]|nr:hypothetical protein [Opitutales bacterium]